MRQILRKNPDKQILRQQKKPQKKRYENICSEKQQENKNYKRTDGPTKNRRKLYENRCSGKKPAETVQTFSKETGTANKISSWALSKLPVREQGLKQKTKRKKLHRNR
jgi:hypothetical protein